jgi:hypothetical protein
MSPMLITGPVRMLAIVRAENSGRVLSAMASKTGVKLRLSSCLPILKLKLFQV